MPRTLSVINVFLASPSDVADERRVVSEIIAELNQSITQDLGMMLSLVRWEDLIPSIELTPQQVVNDQAEIDDSDIFLGVLWNRFGTQTDRAESGTEEEFRIAYDSWKRNRKPKIMFYFCQRPTNFQNETELSQKAKVLVFKQLLSHMGLIREFSTTEKFSIALRQDLTKHLIRLGQAVSKGALLTKGQPTWEKGTNATNELDATSTEASISGMVKIRAGSFKAGRSGEFAAIEYDYYIDEVPVTNRDFYRFMNETGFMLRRPGVRLLSIVDNIRRATQTVPDHPVTKVTWYDAQAYANWIGKRLPLAIEWERAARGTDGRLYPWGNQFNSSHCNCKESGIGSTTPVRAYANGVSEDGCYDMVGNVFEWVADWATKPRFSSAPNTEKLNRGGSYNRNADDLVCWYEESDPPDLRMTDVGFRCVWSNRNES